MKEIMHNKCETSDVTLLCVPGMKMLFLNVQVIKKLKLCNSRVASSHAKSR